MSQGFQRPITIKAAMDGIRDHTYLLPAIQRRFVWGSDKVEALFDSVMQRYPINSFMFWKITDSSVKRDVRFYDFLLHYRERFQDKNSEVNTRGGKDFYAVIDGQQRLTALYIGLLGSYAYKLPRVWWVDDEAHLPTRRLYLDLTATSEGEEPGMLYDFRFLTAGEAAAKSDAVGAQWFRVGDILDYPTREALDDLMDAKEISDKQARKTLRRLWDAVHAEEVVNFYVETNQAIDVVLDIFIRTNSGGVPLSYSDLLMSYTTSQWRERDARDVFDRLVQRVFTIGSPGFSISRDFLLKTSLMLHATDVRFKLKNLDPEVIARMERDWDRFAMATVAAFEFLAGLGFHDLSLRTKTAVIPIIQFVFRRGIEADFTNPLRYGEEKAAIRTWLCLCLLKGVFRAQTDAVLNVLRRIIASSVDEGAGVFPLDAIRAVFHGHPSRSLTFDDATIDEMLRTQIDEPACFPLLLLVYSHLDYSLQRVDIDHLHPAAEIARVRELPLEQRPPDYEFVVDPANWNAVPNLQPLHESLNRSKQDQPLADWVAEKRIDRSAHLLPADLDLGLGAFKPFIERRRAILGERLRTLVAG